MKLSLIKEIGASVFKKAASEPCLEYKHSPVEGYRGKIKFYPEKCVNCGMCIKVCAPSAIIRTTKEAKEGEVITFEFNMGSCTFCQMCSDFCARKAIELSNEYSVIGQEREELIVRGTFVKKSR